MASDLVMAAWLGVVLGIAIATFWPYWNVLQSTGAKFEWKYLASGIVSAVISLPTAPAVYAIVVSIVPAGLEAYVASEWFIFAVGIAVGVLANRIFNEKVVDKGKGKGTVDGAPKWTDSAGLME